MATATIRPEPPLVVIVGPTASGKTALAIRVAKECGGEIISADSRAIYKGLSIGTAKPTLDEQSIVPHWGIDLVRPDERFTAADFRDYANKKIREIRDKGKMPILVGGTGLYINAVIYDYEFPAAGNDTEKRAQLYEKNLEELHEYCISNNIKLPENKLNKRYVVNAILRNGSPPKRKYTLGASTIVVGIATENSTLRDRITQRANDIIRPEVLQEASAAAEQFGWECEAMTGNIYPLIRQYNEGYLTKNELEERFIAKDWHLAKRQRLWFQRDKHIHWDGSDELHTYIIRKLVELNNS